MAFVLEILALSYERAAINGLLQNTEILYSYAYDTAIEHRPLTMFSVFGALLVFFASVLVGLNRVYNFEEIISKKLKKNDINNCINSIF